VKAEVGVYPLEVGGPHVQPVHQAFEQCPASAATEQVGEVVAGHRRQGADDDHPAQAEEAALDLVGADQQAHLAGQWEGETLSRD